MLKTLLRKKKKPSVEPSVRERINVEFQSTGMSNPLATPEQFGDEMKQLAIKYDNYPPYFDCLNFACRFMRPFVRKSADYITSHVSDKNAHILDICGGPGNQGLALAQEGFDNYMVADIDENRMAWGELLWHKAGKRLRWQREDASKMSFESDTFDVVTLLGWESPSLPYSYTLKECLRVLKPGGLLIFTYHDAEGITEGNWDFDPERTYSFLPYAISRNTLHMLCSRLGMDVLGEDVSGYAKSQEAFFPDDSPREFPQYIVYARKKG